MLHTKIFFIYFRSLKAFLQLTLSLWVLVLLETRLTIMWTSATHTHSHTTLARLGSRRGFAFALIGCVIWDTRSRLKPCEDRKESLGSIRTGDGSQDIVLISKILKCIWFLPKCLWHNSVFLLVFIQVTEDEWSEDRHRENCKGHMLLLFFFGYRLSPLMINITFPLCLLPCSFCLPPPLDRCG